MKGKILVIGSLNVDLVAGVDHTPGVGETIISTGLDTVPGGKGANQACAAGFLKAEVAMLGAVGNDAYAQMELESLRRAGVDVSHVIVKENGPTGMAFITVNRDGDNCIVVIPGANAELTPEDVDVHMDLIRQCDIVLLQLEIPLPTVCHAAKAAKSYGKTVILDPAPVPEKFPEELYDYVDIIKPNETELAMLTGVDVKEGGCGEAARKLRERGVRDVLVTLGENGVYMDSENCGICHIPAHKVDAVDTTAAGDSFTAGLACMLAQGKDLRWAVEFANTVSSIAVTRSGAQSSMPTLEEVLREMNKTAGLRAE